MCHLFRTHSEFMVEEHELQKEKIQEDYNDKYWDQRYTIVQHRIPSFLQKMADKILSTGKLKDKPHTQHLKVFYIHCLIFCIF